MKQSDIQISYRSRSNNSLKVCATPRIYTRDSGKTFLKHARQIAHVQCVSETFPLSTDTAQVVSDHCLQICGLERLDVINTYWHDFYLCTYCMKDKSCKLWRDQKLPDVHIGRKETEYLDSLHFSAQSSPHTTTHYETASKN